jgi:hypothetical protein
MIGEQSPGAADQRIAGYAWRRFVNGTLAVVGSFWSFLLALAFLVIWTVLGWRSATPTPGKSS